MNEILKGDVLDVLKTLESDSIDLGITSPPYNKGKKGGPIVKSVVYDKFDDNLPEEVYQEQQIEVLNELYRVIKPGGSFFYNHRCRWDDGELIHPMEWLTRTDWMPKQEIIWDRFISGQLRGWRFWQIDERIYWLYKPTENDRVGKELKSKHAQFSSIWSFQPEMNNPHPAPFPLVLPLRIILSLFDGDKGTVIDPYIGSGTTAVACKLLGCDYIGIDLSDEYIEMAEKRIGNYKEEKKFFEEEIKLHKIKGKSYQERKQKKLRVIENEKQWEKFRAK
jgi:site-specific DNA-methyltransferase (adenine-specific)